MKFIKALVLTASIAQFVVPFSAHAAPTTVTIAAQKAALVEAAGAFMYRTQLARGSLETLAKKAPASDLSKASRLALRLNQQTAELSEQIQRNDSKANILNKLNSMEGDFLQFEAAKRAILSRYPSDARLRMTMNNVRRTYYYLKQLATESV